MGKVQGCFPIHSCRSLSENGDPQQVSAMDGL